MNVDVPSTPLAVSGGGWTTQLPLFLPADESASSGAAVKQPKVLIVEDEHIVALGVESALLDAGMEVAGIAATADAAVSLARSTKPDLAVMDIRLAGKRDGVEAALDLFNLFGIRCVFATAYSDAGTRERAAPARPLGWISKPYQAQALIRAIRSGLADLEEGDGR
jgi:two-component system, response regulator PdtaR